MSTTSVGFLYAGSTLFAMFLGMPITLALGAVAILFMALFMPLASLDTVTQNVYEEMSSITLLSIPLFILKGAAIGRSPAGRDLYGAMHAWMHRIPGGLGIANVFACALFAAASYAAARFRKEHAQARRVLEGGGPASAILEADLLSIRDKLALVPKVLPFIILLTGVMVALYGGYATPSETAGLGAVLALLLIAVVYGVWKPRDVGPILSATLRESTMLMLIIGMSLLYSYVMSYLHISQTAAEAIVSLHLSRWVLLAALLVLVMMLGFFLPPVSIILMTAPIILPPLKAAGFDLVWFGIVMTIVMEMGLIHPPVGLNLFVIRNIAPDISLKDVIFGTLPFVALMLVAIVLLCPAGHRHMDPRCRDGTAGQIVPARSRAAAVVAPATLRQA
ncbi:Tripartite ATP-independent transporter, DctM component [Rhizobiales bacterium GAS191]|nr:Tripartite ATP-independent transporter, DctM component [Rhizobiales bacterium GAS191]